MSTFDDTTTIDEDTTIINDTMLEDTTTLSSDISSLQDETLSRMLQRAQWRGPGAPTISGRSCEDTITLRSVNKKQRERWDKACLVPFFDTRLSEINRSIDNCIQNTNTTLTGSNGLILEYFNPDHSWPSFTSLHTTSHTASMVFIWLLIKYNASVNFNRLHVYVQENCDPAQIDDLLGTRTHDDGVSRFIQIRNPDKRNIWSHMTDLTDTPTSFLKGPLQNTDIIHMCISQLSRHDEIKFQHILNILEPWWQYEAMVFNDNHKFKDEGRRARTIKPERLMFFRRLQRLRQNVETAGICVRAILSL